MCPCCRRSARQLQTEVQVSHTLGGYQPTIGDTPHEARVLRAEQNVAHGGMNAVGSDQRVDADSFTILEFRLHAIAMIYESRKTVPDMQALGGESACQCCQHVRAMHVVVGETERGLHRLGE